MQIGQLEQIIHKNHSLPAPLFSYLINQSQPPMDDSCVRTECPLIQF